VLVDAAAALPPASNLTRFIADGADLVTFSGGKGIRGPQSSGILAGRADLIRDAWMNGSPNHSIGRPGKAAKEDIVGLLVALERYLERDHDADIRHWRAQADHIAGVLGSLPGVTTNVLHDWREHPSPRVEVLFDPATEIDAHSIVLELEDGDPRVYVFEPDGPSARANSIVVTCSTMQPGNETIVAEVMAAAIKQRIASPAASAVAAS
jgi:L-seryl-tRNA(Ser) seleniumtransferase